MPVAVLLWCVLALLVIAVLSITRPKQPLATALVYAACAFTSVIAFSAAFAALVSGQSGTLHLPLGIPWLGASFHVDALSAFFLVVVDFGAAAASVYALGYGRNEHSPERVLPFFAAFLAGMNLVILADDAFTFLLSWEFMSLSSWALVLAHHRSADNVRAGYVYILMASFGTFALLLGYGLLAGPDGNYGFEQIRSQHPDAFYSALVLGLALIGAGSKAGLVPLHVWLPLAHPAAPSHASALMSGVMTKVAVYAFIRIVFDLLGPPVWWWGVLVLALGGITSLMGVLYALMQHDLKRLLAYHTVENIGIIFIGLGLALAFRANGLMATAALALTAALFHVFNHSIFKSLLFFGAGAVLTATGERDMEHLGGLIHRMPFTAFAFLVGCAAISALPPFNGFVSEWMTFQAILLSPELPQWGLKLIVPAVGAMLALSAALAAACFVKAFGITFLGRPRTGAAKHAKETDQFSLSVMLVFAAICLLVGVLPGFVIDAIAPAALVAIGGHMPLQESVPWLSIVPIAEGRSSYNGLLVFVFIALSASLSAYVIHLLASRSTRRVPAWDGGFPEASPLTQYTAGSFAQPIRRVFGTLVFRAREQVDFPPPGDPRPAKFQVNLEDVVWDVLYAPLSDTIAFVADRLNVLQFLTIRRYLSLVFAALVVLLLVIAAWR
ncbi:MAG TPA: hydrogenase 4 subunit B [Burkholderiales bacterium]|nr:hydrogenase 4 subunit B [Burkholderiales bacterium]